MGDRFITHVEEWWRFLVLLVTRVGHNRCLESAKHHVTADLWLLVATSLRDFMGFKGPNNWITTSRCVNVGNTLDLNTNVQQDNFSTGS